MNRVQSTINAPCQTQVHPQHCIPTNPLGQFCFLPEFIKQPTLNPSPPPTLPVFVFHRHSRFPFNHAHIYFRHTEAVISRKQSNSNKMQRGAREGDVEISVRLLRASWLITSSEKQCIYIYVSRLYNNAATTYVHLAVNVYTHFVLAHRAVSTFMFGNGSGILYHCLNVLESNEGQLGRWEAHR